ncbi:MAG: SDR family NAD(P)-dependent oxidoreductase, partial [Bacteroidetes bacterium]|nr:SDR family NAD(P)-dependent oxidoreductase [Bacteroidota bacterium]
MSPQKNYALVTGASSGIGLEFARQLAAKGYPLVIVARRIDRLEALRVEILAAYKVDVQILAQDLTAPDAALQVMAALKTKGIVLDILVNNAGYGMGGRFLEMEMSAIERMFQL